jgi:N-acetylneuraminic acid mutarotase
MRYKKAILMRDYFKRIVLFSAVLGSSLAYSQDVWIQKDSVNGPPRASAASFVMHGEGFIVSGLDIIDFNRKMYSYDVDQNDWDNEESIGGANGSGLNRGGAIAFSINDKGYVGLGQGNTAPYYNDLWEFNPETNSWTQKASFIGSPRRQAVAFSIDTLAYVGTGQSANGYENDFYSYNGESNTWTQLNDFGGTARKGAVAFKMGAQAYVGTGDDGVYTNDFWQYEFSTDTWTEKAQFPGTARTGACGWGIFPTAFIACGYDNTLNYKKDVWEYNYFADVWVQRSNFIGSKRTNANAFVIDGIGYLGLGYNGDYLDDFYAYTPILSTTESKVNSLIKSYPNPVINVFNIELSKPIVSEVKINLFDINGKEMTKDVTLKSPYIIQLNFDLPSGVYLYRLESEEVLSAGKLIVE